MSGPSQRWDLAWVGLALVLPAVLLWWLLPGVGEITLGNDYVIWSHRYHLELMHSVRHGSFPLYVPGFCGGQTSAALTLGQHYHPIAWLSALMPGYWQGHALTWHTVLRLITLGLAHVLLYRLLRALKQPGPWAFALSCLLVYNLRMLDMFRYGASLETHTGTLFTLAALGFMWLRPERRAPALALPFALAWLVTSGHPPMVWWALIAVVVFTLAFPWIAQALGRGPTASWAHLREYLGRVGGWGGLGVGFSMAYAAPFYFDFMATNAGRVDQDYSWAAGNNDALWGTLANFFEPLAADAHGAFGGSTLFLLAALVPLAALLKVRLPRVVWFLWAVALLAFLHMQGPRTPVHYLAWRYLPLASATRIAGRSSQLIPLCLVLVLLAAGPALSTWKRIRGRRALSPVLVLVLLVWPLYRIYDQLRLFRPEWGSPGHFREVPLEIGNALAVLGLVVVLLAVLYLALRRNPWMGIALVLALTAQLQLSLAWGTWIDDRFATATLEELDDTKRHDLRAVFDNPGDGFCSQAHTTWTEEVGSLPTQLARLCHGPRFIARGPDALGPELVAPRGGDACVIEVQGETPAPPPRATTAGGIALRHASYNRLVLETETGSPAWLVTALPWTHHWRARVDGTRAEVHRADGHFVAVPLPSGSATVDLRYHSWAALLGALIASLAGIAWVLLATRATAPPRRLWLRIAGITLIILILGTWWWSLHHGADLGTEWTRGSLEP